MLLWDRYTVESELKIIFLSEAMGIKHREGKSKKIPPHSVVHVLIATFVKRNEKNYLPNLFFFLGAALFRWIQCHDRNFSLSQRLQFSCIRWSFSFQSTFTQTISCWQSLGEIGETTRVGLDISSNNGRIFFGDGRMVRRNSFAIFKETSTSFSNSWIGGLRRTWRHRLKVKYGLNIVICL